MDVVSYAKFIFALIFVLGLIGLMTVALRKFGFGLSQTQFKRGQDRRLKLIEVLALDAKHRAVLLRRDDQEHLVILGPDQQTVVETNITPPPEFDTVLDRAEGTEATAHGEKAPSDDISKGESK